MDSNKNDKLVISFGRYKNLNKTINEIFDNDPDYCRWLYSQPFIKIHPEIFEFLESKFINDRDIYLEFGRYNKKNLQFVIKHNFQYLYYLRKCDYVKILYPKLYKAVCYILDNIKVENYY